MVRKISVTLTYCLLLLICSQTASFSQQASPNFKNVVYAEIEGRKLLLDLYMPVGISNPYLIVWVHGGAWQSGSKESPPLGLIPAGYALASIDYRLSGEAKFPALIHDIKAAIRFLRGNAATYKFRKDKIIIWGSSAGGHLAALVGVTNNNPELEGSLGNYLKESSSVQAILDFYGPTNFMTILKQSTPHGVNVRTPALKQLLGQPVEEVPDLAKLASPVFQVDKSDPPLFIAHGDQDIQVPINQSHELEGIYQQNGLKVVFEVLHGADHGHKGYYTPDFLKKAEVFLKDALK